MRALACATFAAFALAARPAAALDVVFTLDPASAAITGTLDAIADDSRSFAVSGTIAATVELGPGNAPVLSFDPTGGVLLLTPSTPFSVEFGEGFGAGGAPHVDLALAATTIQVVLGGPGREATPTGPNTSTAPLGGLTLDLVAGFYLASGEIFGQTVALAVDFAANPAQVDLSSNAATFTVADGNPDEVILTLPVQLGLLVVPAPLYVPLRLTGSLVLRAPICVTCIAACADASDNDGDGLVNLLDPGCASAFDVSERSASLPCDDGFDNDGDALVDAKALPAGGDPVCVTPAFLREYSACQDGQNNDGALGTDFDGGVSILGAGNGDPNGLDPQCAGKPQRSSESPSCGLGVELALLVPLLVWPRGRRSRS